MYTIESSVIKTGCVNDSRDSKTKNPLEANPIRLTRIPIPMANKNEMKVRKNTSLN